MFLDQQHKKQVRGHEWKRMILICISVENGVELAMATRNLFPLVKAASRTSSKEWGFLLIYVCHRDLGKRGHYAYLFLSRNL